jgi:hypothetical protein
MDGNHFMRAQGINLHIAAFGLLIVVELHTNVDFPLLHGST